MIPVGLVVAFAGFGAAVWASTVEDGPPGWRSAVAGGLLAVGCVLVLAGSVT